MNTGMWIASTVLYMGIADIIAMRHREAETRAAGKWREADPWLWSFVYGMCWPVTLPLTGWFGLN